MSQPTKFARSAPPKHCSHMSDQPWTPPQSKDLTLEPYPNRVPEPADPSCWELVIPRVSAEIANRLTDLLLGLGASSAELAESRIAGAPEQPIFDFDWAAEAAAAVAAAGDGDGARRESRRLW